MKKKSDGPVRSGAPAVSFPLKPQRNDPDENSSPMFAATIPTTHGEGGHMTHAVDMNEDVALFRDFLAGDDVAAIKVFRKFHRRLFVYCVKVLGNTEQAEDVVGEVWERVARLRDNPIDIRNPIAFLFRIARNLCLNAIRDRRDHASLSTLAESDHPREVESERSDIEDRLLAALDELPLETREIVVLNAYCGYRFDEIAIMLGKSPDAIWARASRARAQLRRMMLAVDGTSANHSADERDTKGIDDSTDTGGVS